MIIQKCDICNREVPILDNIILYKKPIDFCNRCRDKIEKAKQEYKKEVDYEYCILDSKLRNKERNIISKLKENYRDIKIKD